MGSYSGVWVWINSSTLVLLVAPPQMLDTPHIIQSGDQLNSYNVAQLQYAL
jgi:hypothetical protein